MAYRTRSRLSKRRFTRRPLRRVSSGRRTRFSVARRRGVSRYGSRPQFALASLPRSGLMIRR